MFHYLFTNDLRISNLENTLIEAGRLIKEDIVPSGADAKSVNNNVGTVGFYFGLTKSSNCTIECVRGNVRKVVLNFIKKFQFPNPRTPESLQNAIDDGIRLQPMRIILSLLHLMRLICPEQAYLTNKEIADFVFFNENVAKSAQPDLVALVHDIINARGTDGDQNIPDDEALEKMGIYWNQCRRQVREMVKILCWSGCVIENGDGSISIHYDSLSRDNEADIFEVLTYNDFWDPIPDANLDQNKESYQEYMDIAIDDNEFYHGECVDTILPRNWIVFGAPGTGKSFLLEQKRKELLGEDNKTDYERVTFHLDYSYANFVGTYKPVMVESNRNKLEQRDREVLSILTDSKINTQQKNDQLHACFGNSDDDRIPILLGLYDGTIIPEKNSESDATDSNAIEINRGRAIRPYVNLFNNNNYESDGIAYQFVPGPFMRILANALKSVKHAKLTETRPKPYLLIIEEINRANTAAVFGDVFQLLDRDDNNESEYPIQTSKEMREYLAYAVDGINGNPDDYSKIKIPNNMFIWATMNSADQGVFPMDTAFKRRWDFTYLGIDTNEEGIRGESFKIGSEEEQTITWNAIRKAINDFLARMNINEDKQLGPYFLSRSIISPNADVSEEEKDSLFCSAFKDKVLMYLFEDAARQKRNDLFDLEKPLRYSKICEEFDRIGVRIFNDEIRNNALNYSKDEVVEEVREEQGTVEFDNDAANNADTDA